MPDGTQRTFGDQSAGSGPSLGSVGAIAALAGPQTGIVAAAAPQDRQWLVDVLKEAKRIIAINLGRDFSVPWILWVNDEAPKEGDTALAYAFPSLLPEAIRTLFELGCQFT